MRSFEYVRAKDAEQALHLATQVAANNQTAEHGQTAERGAQGSKTKPVRAAYIAGGTSLVDLMKIDIERPERVIDINGLPLRTIEESADGLTMGALASNSEVAEHELVKGSYRALSEALLAGASPQLRHMATMAGNLLQRTRCPYFRDVGAPCNKREPASGCSAIEGYNRMHAVLGGSPHCVAVHPSDLCVALVALDAVVHTEGPQGKRRIPMADFHRLPETRPELETVLEPNELITQIVVPKLPFFASSRYLKVRDRSSYAFALASAAVALELRDGKIFAARVALGGVATKPWRSAAAEKELLGQTPEREAFERAAKAAAENAKPLAHNAFKITLLQRTIVRALEAVGETT